MSVRNMELTNVDLPSPEAPDKDKNQQMKFITWLNTHQLPSDWTQILSWQLCCRPGQGANQTQQTAECWGSSLTSCPLSSSSSPAPAHPSSPPDCNQSEIRIMCVNQSGMSIMWSTNQRSVLNVSTNQRSVNSELGLSRLRRWDIYINKAMCPPPSPHPILFKAEKLVLYHHFEILEIVASIWILLGF